MIAITEIILQYEKMKHNRGYKEKIVLCVF